MPKEIAIQIQGKERTVSELLKAKKYSIDYYQREYRWETKHITELIEDLANKFFSYYDKKHTLPQVGNYGNYFLGCIVISHKEGENFIVDGQQRLTSLTLLLIYLNNLQAFHLKPVDVKDLIFSEVYGEKSFNIDIDERTACMEALYSDKKEQIDLTDASESVRNLVSRYTDIEENFPEELRQEALPYFIWWLQQKVVLVEIIAFSDEDAYTIFETMNDRGLSLSPTDMLKGYLLANVNGTNNKDQLNELWKDRLYDLIKISKEDEADFFKAWLRAQSAETIRERKKGATNKDFDIIGTVFHKWVRDEHVKIGLNRPEDYRDFILRQFTYFSNYYINIRQAAMKFNLEFEYIYYNASNYFTLQYALLLAPLTTNDDPETAKKKIRLVSGYIDIFIARRVWNFRTLGYSAIVYTMFNLMKEIRGKSVSDLAAMLHQKVDELEDTFDSNDRLRIHQQNHYYIHRMLARITNYIESQCGIESSYATYIDTNIKKPFEVEHIWADKFERHTDEFNHPTDFGDYRNRIGGLVLIPKGFNQSLNDDEYETKMQAYFGQNMLARSLNSLCYQNNPAFNQYIQRSGLQFKPHAHFNKADLDERQELYRQICKQIWSTDRFENELK